MKLNTPNTMVSYLKKFKAQKLDEIDFRTLWSLVLEDCFDTIYPSSYGIKQDRLLTYYKIIYNEKIEKEFISHIVLEMTDVVHFTIKEMLERYYHFIMKYPDLQVVGGEIDMIHVRNEKRIADY